MSYKLALAFIGLVVVAIMGYLSVPTVTICGPPAKEAKTLNNLKQIGQVSLMYAQEHDNLLPASIRELRDVGYLSEDFIFDSPFGPKNEMGYEFKVSGSFPPAQPPQIILADRYANEKGFRAVYYSNGSVRLAKDQDSNK